MSTFKYWYTVHYSTYTEMRHLSFITTSSIPSFWNVSQQEEEADTEEQPQQQQKQTQPQLLKL